MVDPTKELSEIAQLLLIPGSAPSKRVMDDPFLNYFALGLLIFVVIVNLYGIITILRNLSAGAPHDSGTGLTFQRAVGSVGCSKGM